MTTIALLHFNDETARMTADVFDVPSVSVPAVLPSDRINDALSSGHLENTLIRFMRGDDLVPEKPEVIETIEQPEPTHPDNFLSPREIEVMDLVADGLTNEQIGERLFIAHSTVRAHVGTCLSKLGVSNRLKAVHATRAQMRERGIEWTK